MSDEMRENEGGETNVMLEPSPTQPAQASAAEPPTSAVLPLADHPLNGWFERWFPENSSGPSHPIKYLSAEWHHARDAFEDLKKELKTKIS